jgi:cytoskeleton protein RodZ
MMEQLPENNAGQDDDVTVTPVATLGTTLREARERGGFSVADVAHQIKFAPRQIEALEADDFQNLPEMTFLCGFVRSYAKVLNMDAQPLLALLPQANAAPLPLIPISVEVPFPNAYSPQLHNLIWLGAALLLAVLVVVFAVWQYTAPLAQPEVTRVETPVSLPSKMQIIPASPVLDAEVTTPTVTPTVTPAVTPTAQPELVAASSPVSPSLVLTAKPSASKPRDEKLTASVMRPETAVKTQPLNPATQPDTSPQTASLRLVFDDDAWVEIKDKDDKRLSSQINLRGSELRLSGYAPFSLVISRAASVRLFLRGKQVDLTPYTRSSSEVARLTLE